MNQAFRTLLAVFALACFLGCSGGGGGRAGEGGSGGASGAGPDSSRAGAGRADAAAPSLSQEAAAGRLGETGSAGAGSISDRDALNSDAAADSSAADSREDRAPDASGVLASDASQASDAPGAADVTIADSGVGDGGAVDELIHYYGRWNRLADRAITVNTGSHVVAQFSGTAIAARFDVSLNLAPNPTLAWRIDQGAWQEGELAATLSLATGLTGGTHEVLVMVRGLNENQNRWSPPLVSSITFLGFQVTGGALDSSPRPLRATIEFLGDSITEGINVWTAVNGLTTPCWRSDGRLAYPSQTAQLLGAEWRQVGFGRQGLLIVGNGGVPFASDSFNFIYRDVPRDGWQPDMVAINEGTNDGTAAAAAFRTAYAAYLTNIRRAYPSAKIVAMRPFNGSQAAPIQAEVNARTAAGDARVFYVDTTGWLVAADFTDGLHPNAQGSTKAAQALVVALRAIGVP